MPSPLGNRITDNAFTADDGRDLIARALQEIGERLGWQSIEPQALFSGVYYDRTKVGSFITRVTNRHGESAVLKIQLKPLPFDEGFIIRHIERENRSARIRLPRIVSDEAWNEARGYGYVLFEDASALPNIWTERVPNAQDLLRHEDFLQEFLHVVLPVTPWLPPPEIDPKEKYREAFAHFSAIAQASNHRHIDHAEVDRFREAYFACLDRMTFEGFHFTHGHLSGKDIKYDAATDGFVVFANLYWSYRPSFYEITFPTWVELMHIQNPHVSVKDFLTVIEHWSALASRVYGYDVRDRQTYWFNLLERAMLTIMLDLGASEWTASEVAHRQPLLTAWKDLFHWLLKEKLHGTSDLSNEKIVII